jgi:DNA-directed RNA polymerase specialized sigma24 family protein
MKPFEFTPQQIYEHMNKMTAPHFNVLCLRAENRTITEMALLLVVPKGTVKSRLHRATKNLRAHIQQAS